MLRISVITLFLSLSKRIEDPSFRRKEPYLYGLRITGHLSITVVFEQLFGTIFRYALIVFFFEQIVLYFIYICIILKITIIF